MSTNPLDATVTELVASTSAAIATRAESLGVSVESLRRAFIIALEGSRRDGRAADWRVRLMLFRAADGYREAEADSDPHVPLGEPGVTVINGLPNVLHWISELASGHHGRPCVGLDNATLQMKLRSLRSMLTHRGTGEGQITADYRVWIGEREEKMRAVCFVWKVDPENPVEERRDARMAPHLRLTKGE